jgi:hypothetical protein
VRIRAQIDARQNVVTIPTPALQRGPNGLYAWVIKPDNTAEQRNVDAQTVDGDTVIVSRGPQHGREGGGQRPVPPAGRHARRCQDRHGRRRRRESRRCLMSISEPFIRRPIATALLSAALALIGIVTFPLLPIAPLPQVDFPTISVSAQLPGASPDTMAATSRPRSSASSGRSRASRR